METETTGASRHAASLAKVLDGLAQVPVKGDAVETEGDGAQGSLLGLRARNPQVLSVSSTKTQMHMPLSQKSCLAMLGKRRTCVHESITPQGRKLPREAGVRDGPRRVTQNINARLLRPSDVEIP